MSIPSEPLRELKPSGRTMVIGRIMPESDMVTLERGVLAPILLLLKRVASQATGDHVPRDTDKIDARDHFLRLSSAIARSDAERELSDAAKGDTP